jgi:hypothetical protein
MGAGSKIKELYGPPTRHHIHTKHQSMTLTCLSSVGVAKSSVTHFYGGGEASAGKILLQWMPLLWSADPIPKGLVDVVPF